MSGDERRRGAPSLGGAPAPAGPMAFELPLTPDFQPGGQGHTCAVRCKAGCCRYFSLPLETPRSASDFSDIRWYLMHEATHVYKYEGSWYLLILSRCKSLLPNNLCAVYDDRPQICRDYDPTDCEFTGDVDYELYFETHQQFEAWLAQGKAKRKAARRPTAAARPRKRAAAKRSRG